jgi:DNA repair protein RadC
MMTNEVQSLFSVTEVEISYRNPKRIKDRPLIRDSQQAYDLLLQAWDMNKIELLEEFIILLLDKQNRCIGLSKISSGGISACLVDPKIVFATALKARASGLILAHNHPSGNIVPSNADQDLTGKLREGGLLLELPILDHIIVTPTNYFSFTDERLLPSG